MEERESLYHASCKKAKDYHRYRAKKKKKNSVTLVIGTKFYAEKIYLQVVMNKNDFFPILRKELCSTEAIVDQITKAIKDNDKCNAMYDTIRVFFPAQYL